MTTFMVINGDGLVINSVEADTAEIVNELYPNSANVAIEIEEGLDLPGIGWTYTNGSWTRPINPFEPIE
jgi:hypothetical protein